jgi:FkbM family methyltransferase
MNRKNIGYILIFLILILLILKNIYMNNNIEYFQNINSYSQIKQDLKVLSFYDNKMNGFFVEIGANDGITLSNTYLLEKDFNWNGICIEALPDKFNELIKNRKSININKAVYDITGKILNFSSNDLLSGITDKIDRHLETKNKQQISVETVTLNDILEENNAPTFIDYISIDTEGSEFEIIKSVDLNKYTFGLIHLEHNFVEPRRSDMKKYLLENGYLYKGENEFDDEYIHSSLVDNIKK